MNTKTRRALYRFTELLPSWTRQAFIPRPPVQATYNADGMATMHVAPFLEDAKFMDAYRAGMATTHKFSKHTRIDWRVYVSCWAAKQGLAREGAFVECGVNTGLTALAVCKYLDLDGSDRPYYLLDTYKGIPLSQLDERERDYGSFLNDEMYYDCYDEVVETFKPFPSVRIVRGLIPETLTAIDAPKISYLSIDLNNAFAEKCVLEYLWDRLVPGALIVFDDYGFTEHAEQRKVHDAFAAARGTFVLALPTGQGLLMKA